MKMFCYPFLPSTLQLFKKLLQLGEESLVDQFYKTITSSILKDYEVNNFSKSEDIDCQNQNCLAFEIVTSFIFLTEFIPWCKQLSRTAKYDFKDDILKYMEFLISYGVMERLLSYCSETANAKLSKCTTGQTCTISEHCFKRISTTYTSKISLSWQSRIVECS